MRTDDIRRSNETTKKDSADGFAKDRLGDGNRRGRHIDDRGHAYTDFVSKAKVDMRFKASPQAEIRVPGQGRAHCTLTEL